MGMERLRHLRRRVRVMRKAKEIEALFELVERAAPCPDPGCKDFRHQMKRVMHDDL